MDFYGRPRRFSLSSSSPFGDFIGKVKVFCNFAVSAIIGNIFSAVLTFLFALVGTLLGAMTGALIGQETESGFVRGAAVGAISGAVFSIEVFESSLILWQSDESGILCLLYLIDVIASLLSGRLVRERIGPAMLSAVQSQIGAAGSTFEEVQNIFDTGGARGLAGDLVEKIPKITIRNNDNADASGEKVSCSVCLQDFQLGETVRSLPQCNHLFHLPCIDKWLLSHGSCPLCRRDLFRSLKAEKLKLRRFQVDELEKGSKNNIRLLSKGNHLSLVGLVGFCEETGSKGAKILVYEFILHGIRRGGRNLTWRQLVNIAIGAAKVLSSQIKGKPGYLDPALCASFYLSRFSDVYRFDVYFCNLLLKRAISKKFSILLYYHGPCNMEMMLTVGELQIRCVAKTPKDVLQ
ncbi:hypothetical protein V6N11_043845 [Hibiscus sabdariffa]|uniref:RING-type domain-containing protein n=1 Tax=Hibiscus sabdariffa TaxID=183260 RepID=A0ABR2RDP8_9ROSI